MTVHVLSHVYDVDVCISVFAHVHVVACWSVSSCRFYIHCVDNTLFFPSLLILKKLHKSS